MSAHILVVDDNADERSDVAQMVASLGYQITEAADGSEALRKLASSQINVILTDLVMPRMDGIALLRDLAARGDKTPTIVLTGCGSIDHAISVVHDLNAFWFLEKPVRPGVLRALLERAVQQNQLLQQAELLSNQLSYQGVLGDLIGDSPSMKEVFSIIRQVAPTTASVLITGESGTGKELVARAIHSFSRRASGPFVAINCAALPEELIESEMFGHEKGAFTGAVERRAGCFEQAHGGTLLLDEIGDMPVGTQAKLLRVLEESKVRRLGSTQASSVDVRVLAATNRRPQTAIQDNRLREDLFYRLNVFHIDLPPLRQRKNDIPAIAAGLIRDLNKKHSCRVTQIAPDVIARFQTYSWPGNVRELRNVVERATIVAGEGEIQLRHLPGSFVPQPPGPVQEESRDTLSIRVGERLEDIERAYIRLVLNYTNNNKTRTAEVVGLSVRALHYKLNAYEEDKSKGAAAGSDSSPT